MPLGISSDDFSNGVLNDMGVVVDWEEATKTTDNISGSETLTYAATTEKTVVFRKRVQRYIQGKEGLIDLGDAIILATTSYNFKKDDKISYDGETYIITKVIQRWADDEHLFDSCTLIKTNNT